MKIGTKGVKRIEGKLRRREEKAAASFL